MKTNKFDTVNDIDLKRLNPEESQFACNNCKIILYSEAYQCPICTSLSCQKCTKLQILKDMHCTKCLAMIILQKIDIQKDLILHNKGSCKNKLFGCNNKFSKKKYTKKA